MKGPDVVKFDSELKSIYVACYSGAISVFQDDDPDHFRKLEEFPVQKKVHSLAVDKDTQALLRAGTGWMGILLQYDRV